MNWEQCRSVMEQSVIKIDVMAADSAYFLATHVPFSNLELRTGWESGASAQYKNEEEIFTDLVCADDQLDRMIVVRGSNGTGKSHLVRVLATKYRWYLADREEEARNQIVFLRRLNNSVRGVFSQLLEQDVIYDSDMREKLQNFVKSSESKEKSAFQTEILLAYVGAVQSDKSKKTYPPILCRDLAQFLSDSRVQEHLMRENGAISRCYRILTTPSDQVLTENAVFSEEDFNNRELLKNVRKSGNEEAKNFEEEIHGNPEEINKLVQYLNGFTGQVVQRCADITSENAKDIFRQLRRELKTQGKNLTIFIEDFTGFTGIDSELITALSAEHGGEYSDLCKVTSVIGITDAYYDQFRDNFKERVSHQVTVSEQAYGQESFLADMVGRYLNAIYCEPTAMEQWYQRGADPSELPISAFVPPCPWETVKIGERDATLYPFNHQAIMKLYQKLPVKSPRLFLKEVFQPQMKAFLDGKEYGDEWEFPLNPALIPMDTAPHSSAIDRMEQISAENRTRLKNVFAIWGDGSIHSTTLESGAVCYGGVDRSFLADIGLEMFTGLDSTPQAQAPKAAAPAPPPAEPENKPIKEDPKTRDYRRKKQDIAEWMEARGELRYTSDYKGLVRKFLLDAINWQDIGVPAYIAAKRLENQRVIAFEGRSEAESVDKALVYVDRSVESCDALLALVEYKYAENWEFENAPFYQQKLISWLERRKLDIVRNIMAAEDYEHRRPMAEWCLALQYLRAAIQGVQVDTSTPLKTVKSLLRDLPKPSCGGTTAAWKSVSEFVMRNEERFDAARDLLKESANTVMGAVQRSAETTVYFYRTEELLRAAEKLTQCGWDIEQELPEEAESNMLLDPAYLLKKLYPRVRQVVAAEKQHAAEVCQELRNYVGELNEQNLVGTYNAVRQLYDSLAGSISYTISQRDKFSGSPIEKAQQILQAVQTLHLMEDMGEVRQLAVLAGPALPTLETFRNDLCEVERLADTERQKAERDRKQCTEDADVTDLAQAAVQALGKLCDALDEWEVQYADGDN